MSELKTESPGVEKMPHPQEETSVERLHEELRQIARAGEAAQAQSKVPHERRFKEFTI